IAKRRVIVTPVRHSMPLTWNMASALGMEFERHDRSSRRQRRQSVPKLLKRPPRPYPCTKVDRRPEPTKAKGVRIDPCSAEPPRHQDDLAARKLGDLLHRHFAHRSRDRVD